MHCPNCGTDDIKVVDSRAQNDCIKRRRSCVQCAYRFTTFERIEKRYPMVRKKEGALERFLPQKVRIGLENAFRKRTISAEIFTQLITDIDMEVSAHTGAEIGSNQIGQLILERLQELDMVAYVRFASVYCEVNTLEEFMDLLPNVRTHSVQDG
jgi:transcriptional repressor NrdR